MDAANNSSDSLSVVTAPAVVAEGTTEAAAPPESLWRDVLNLNVVALALCLSAGEGAFFIQVSTTSLAAAAYAEQSLATLPIGAMLAVGTGVALLLPFATERFGCRLVFVCTALCAALGAMICLLGTWYERYWMLVAGGALLGFQVPCTLYYRLAVIALVPQRHDVVALALVTVGGLICAVMGPQLAKETVDLFSAHQYSGCYIVTLVEMTSIAAITTLIRWPTLAALDAASIGLGAAGPQHAAAVVVAPSPSSSFFNLFSPSVRSGQQWITVPPLFRNRRYWCAVAAAAVSWPGKAFMVSAAPLAMKSFGFDYDQSTTAVELHAVGMFTPSLLTGFLVRRFGARPVVLAGFVIFLLGITTAEIGTSGLLNFYLTLLTLGLGWNLAYLGGSSELVDICRTHAAADARRLKAVYEAAVMSAMTLSFTSSAFILTAITWRWLVCLVAAYAGLTWLLLILCAVRDRPPALRPVPLEDPPDTTSSADASE